MATQKKKPASKNTKARPTVVIDEEIEIGKVELSERNALCVSLISSNGKRYVAITQKYKRKTDDVWATRGGKWIPFSETTRVCSLLERAYIEGKTRHWDESFPDPVPVILSREDQPPNQQDLKSCHHSFC